MSNRMVEKQEEGNAAAARTKMEGHVNFNKKLLKQNPLAVRILFVFAVLAGLILVVYLLTRANSNTDTNQQAGKSGHGRKAGDVAAVPVTVALAKNMILPLEIRNIGNVEAFSVVNVIAQVGGQLTDVYFKQGQYVEKGRIAISN